jgi:hypothetical protein
MHLGQINMVFLEIVDDSHLPSRVVALLLMQVNQQAVKSLRVLRGDIDCPKMDSQIEGDNPYEMQRYQKYEHHDKIQNYNRPWSPHEHDWFRQ